MTRAEFVENIEDFNDLIMFCYQEDIDICDNVVDQERYNDTIMERLRNYEGFDTWQEAYQFLRNLPDDYDYYREDDYGDFEGLTDDDFDSYKQDVMDYMDRNAAWDIIPPEDDEEEDEPDEEYIDTCTEANPCDSDEIEISDEEFVLMIGNFVIGKAG